MEYNWICICLSKDYDLILLLPLDMDGEAALIIGCSINRTKLTVSVSNHKAGGGKGANASCNVILSIFSSKEIQVWYHHLSKDTKQVSCSMCPRKLLQIHLMKMEYVW